LPISACDRRADRNQAVIDVGFVVADDLVRDGVARLQRSSSSTVDANTTRPSASSAVGSMTCAADSFDSISAMQPR
jgi:hypothetical protein